MMHSVLGSLLAQAGASESGLGLLGRQLGAAILFSVLGLLMLALCIWLMCRFAPFSVVKEIEEDQNTALGIVMGAVLIGMSIIIAASIMG